MSNLSLIDQGGWLQQPLDNCNIVKRAVFDHVGAPVYTPYGEIWHGIGLL